MKTSFNSEKLYFSYKFYLQENGTLHIGLGVGEDMEKVENFNPFAYKGLKFEE